MSGGYFFFPLFLLSVYKMFFLFGVYQCNTFFSYGVSRIAHARILCIHIDQSAVSQREAEACVSVCERRRKKWVIEPRRDGDCR